MSIAKTTDFGLTWNVLGPIITPDQPNAPHSEGEGDCTGIDGHNEFITLLNGATVDASDVVFL